MSKSVRSTSEKGEWITLRDFTDDGEGFTLPKYEAKYIGEVEKKHMENDLVIVRETSAGRGSKQNYLFPREAIERLADQLP